MTETLLPPEPLLAQLAAREGLRLAELRELLASGRAVALGAPARAERLRACAVGAKLSAKVNANLGSSALAARLDEELAKLAAAVEAGADTVMDLSTGGEIAAIRAAILERSPLPVGSVPLYEAAVGAAQRGGPAAMAADEMIAAVERQAAAGVDFMTIHAAIRRELVSSGLLASRRTGIVSRGGALLACWMQANAAENPFYERYDEVLEICRSSGVTISLGDALRPGCLADAGDRAQLAEIAVMGELVRRARAAGVRVMVEGPGHLPLDQVAAQVRLIKEQTAGAPLYVLGPLVTDVAPGYDHIAAAIGGALAVWAGADFLCYVTRAEHVCLPDAEAVREGVIASRIAAHAGDLARGLPAARAWDERLAAARRARDWPAQFALALEPARPAAMRAASGLDAEEECTMCGPLCALRMAAETDTVEDEKEEASVSSLAELGEFGAIARLVSDLPQGPGVVVGVGDDAALIETPQSRLLLTVDMLIEGRHFLPGADPVALGYKAVAVNVSDLAAMGGAPSYALLALSLPVATRLAWLDGLRAGLAEAASDYGVTLVGGDTTAGEAVVLALTLVGVPSGERVVTRGGAQPGDVVCVTNTLGDAYGGLRLTLAAASPAPQPRDEAEALLLAAYRRPVARLAAGRAAAASGAHAMIDVSDGLLADLGHICERSRVGAELEAARLPLSAALRSVAERLGFDPRAAALNGGEDYELLISVAPPDLPALRGAVEATGSRLCEIGRLQPGAGVRLKGAPAPAHAGWDHFRA